MSLSVKCTITVSDEVYEAGTKREEIIYTYETASMTGTFANLPKVFIGDAIESATDGAKAHAHKKLEHIKGDK